MRKRGHTRGVLSLPLPLQLAPPLLLFSFQPTLLLPLHLLPLLVLVLVLVLQLVLLVLLVLHRGHANLSLGRAASWPNCLGLWRKRSILRRHSLRLMIVLRGWG